MRADEPEQPQEPASEGEPGEREALEGLTPQQSAFVVSVATTGDIEAAGESAGYQLNDAAARILGSPAVQGALRKRRKARAGGLAMKAVKTLNDLMAPSIAANVRLGAAKLVLELAGDIGRGAEAPGTKTLDEMTYDELQAFIHRADAVIEGRIASAKTVSAPDPGISPPRGGEDPSPSE